MLAAKYGMPELKLSDAAREACGSVLLAGETSASWCSMPWMSATLMVPGTAIDADDLPCPRWSIPSDRPPGLDRDQPIDLEAVEKETHSVGDAAKRTGTCRRRPVAVDRPGSPALPLGKFGLANEPAKETGGGT